ncbi:MAG: uracil-DNA glycosylase [Deltaproteobacteria bacterium]|nr:uracil-DNA glycosylase [Deltaproteobacteria bacterium]
MPLSESARQVIERLDSLPDSRETRRLAALARLEARCQECTDCRLAESRNKVVFGEGSVMAEIMFIGEGPGRDEDRSGRPFIGRAGELLTDMIKAMGLSREEVYIANIVKCRPPENRNPEPEESLACRPWLKAQLELIQPRFIIALGAVAARNLLETSEPISRLRGRFHDFEGRPLMPTFHPAYLLRNYSQENRRQVWSDLKQVLARLDRKPPSK